MFPYSFVFVLLISVSLSAQSKNSILTELARDSIIESFTKQHSTDKISLIEAHPFLQEKRASFVTLNKNNILRGCIGSLQPEKTLFDDLYANAKSAAFKDRRFQVLQKDELSGLEIEVSVLGQARTIAYHSLSSLKSQIKQGKDGIVLQQGNKRATFLPQVWEQLNNFDDFFTSLCLKAGLDKKCLEQHPDISSYRVEKYSEKDLSKRPIPHSGYFYPRQCKEIKTWFSDFKKREKNVSLASKEVVPKALLVPHAGYKYSGYTADKAYRFAQSSTAKRIVIIGPSHHVSFEGISVNTYEAYQTPCGILRNDEVYAQELIKKLSLKFVKDTHGKEHSTEVQLPFINHYFPQTKVIELIYSKTQKHQLKELITHILQDKDNLLILSSDLSHYHAQDKAHAKDYICLESLEKMDSKLLKNGCEACGYEGIEALLEVVHEMGFKSKLLDYRTSADSNADKSSVVGYASAIFWK